MNGVAEVLQTHDEASGVDGFGPLVEVVRAEIAIELTADSRTKQNPTSVPTALSRILSTPPPFHPWRVGAAGG